MWAVKVDTVKGSHVGDRNKRGIAAASLIGCLSRNFVFTSPDVLVAELLAAWFQPVVMTGCGTSC